MLINVGINHQTAPLEVLEKITFSADESVDALAAFHASPVVSEVVLVSTCNRVEVYAQGEKFHDAYQHILQCLAAHGQLNEDLLSSHLYVHYGPEAVRHLFSVACGLDSAVLGEHEILGQVHRSLAAAQKAATTGPNLHLLFQRAAECGKKARTETAIGRHTMSIAYAIIENTKTSFATHSEENPLNVLLLGAGEFGSSIVRTMAKVLPLRLTVANRTKKRADKLAAELAGRSIEFDSYLEHVSSSDVIISATSAPTVLFSTENVAPLVGGKSTLFVDVAVPRDVSQEIAELPNASVLTLAQLQEQVQSSATARSQEVAAVQEIISQEVQRYLRDDKKRSVSPLIGDLHRWADDVRNKEVDRYAKMFAELGDKDKKAIEALTKSVVAKLLHGPTVKLKDTAGTLEGELLAQASREFFDQS